jgi:hypothetical protein
MGKAFIEKPVIPQLLKKFFLVSGMRRRIVLLTLACLRPLA